MAIKKIVNREVWVDWMRVLACFMVMLIHCTEPFYLGGDGALVLTKADAFWASFIDSAVRMCVPLFVIASSYLQFPTKYSSAEFLKKRTLRIVVPFVLWSIFYALYWGEPVENLKSLLLNFNYAAGHLWFVYMLVGIYLLIPLLSPWAKNVGKRELQIYLLIWLVTTVLPLIRDYVSGATTAITYGPTGIPRQAIYPIWGEASWNTYGSFYYISGFIGFMLLGLYFRRFVPQLSIKKTLLAGFPIWLAGFVISGGGMLRRILAHSGGVFPAKGGLDVAVWWETTITYDTLGVALMAIGAMVMLKRINASGWIYQHIVLPVSKASYGMYLSHMVVLAIVIAKLRDLWGIGEAGVFGMWTTPVQIVVGAFVTYIIVASCSVAIQKIPKVGKWLMG